MTEQDRVNQIIEQIDDLLLAGSFDLVDKYVSEFDAGEEDPACILALLGAIHPAKDKIKGGADFAVKAESVLNNKLGTARASWLMRFWKPQFAARKQQP